MKIERVYLKKPSCQLHLDSDHPFDVALQQKSNDYKKQSYSPNFLILSRKPGRIISVKGSFANSPISSIGKAFAYSLTLWARFGRYLEDGRLEIDNNMGRE